MQGLKEVWKPIKNYEGLYEISNHGKVKSLKKVWRTGYNHKTIRSKPETFLSNIIDNGGYCFVNLSNIKMIHGYIHLLVWDHFGNRLRNGRILQVDHIDNNKLNNRINNLQLLSNRQNVSKEIDKTNASSIYIGVHWAKHAKKWRARIDINGNQKHLGYFIKEFDAHLAYQKELNRINNE